MLLRHDAAPDSRPGLFSKAPCTRGCKFQRTSAAEGKRRVEPADIFASGLVLEATLYTRL